MDESKSESIQTDSGFELGTDMINKDGNGNNKTVVYKGAFFDGMNHTIHKQEDTNLTTLEYHLRVLDQPEMCNIPSTPIDYCK